MYFVVPGGWNYNNLGRSFSVLKSPGLHLFSPCLPGSRDLPKKFISTSKSPAHKCNATHRSSPVHWDQGVNMRFLRAFASLALASIAAADAVNDLETTGREALDATIEQSTTCSKDKLEVRREW